MEVLGTDVNYFVTADHGGHDQHHGTPMPEDMTIPVLAYGPDVPALGDMGDGVNIIDIAPTILKIYGSKAHRQWEGKALF